MRTEERARDAVRDLRVKTGSILVPPIETLLVRRRRSRAAAAFAAGVALATAVLIPVVLFSVLDGNNEPPVGTFEPSITTTVPPTTTVQSGTLPPSKTPSLPESEPTMDPAEFLAAIPVDFREGWTQPSLAESGLTGARLQRLFPLGDRLVGIGTDSETGRGTVWTSDDGLHWERTGNVYIDTGTTTVPSRPFPLSIWNSIKVGGPGLVAIDTRGSVGAEVWVAELSESDLIWKNTASLSGPCCSIDIAASEGLIVVVSEQVNHQERNPGVWTSTDAYTWERVPPDNLPFGNATHGLAFVEAGGPGFVGIGFGVKGTYVSIDGIEWFSPEDFVEAHPDLVHESLITIGSVAGYLRFCHGDEDGTWICTSPEVRSVASVDGRYIAVSPDGTSLGLSTHRPNWTWLPPTPGTFISTLPVDVVEWRGQIIVLAGDYRGSTTWAWAPPPSP